MPAASAPRTSASGRRRRGPRAAGDAEGVQRGEERAWIGLRDADLRGADDASKRSSSRAARACRAATRPSWRRRQARRRARRSVEHALDLGVGSKRIASSSTSTSTPAIRAHSSRSSASPSRVAGAVVLGAVVVDLRAHPLRSVLVRQAGRTLQPADRVVEAHERPERVEQQGPHATQCQVANCATKPTNAAALNPSAHGRASVRGARARPTSPPRSPAGTAPQGSAAATSAAAARPDRTAAARAPRGRKRRRRRQPAQHADDRRDRQHEAGEQLDVVRATSNGSPPACVK